MKMAPETEARRKKKYSLSSVFTNLFRFDCETSNVTHPRICYWNQQRSALKSNPLCRREISTYSDLAENQIEGPPNS